jgi:hypothetical protein
VSCCLTIEETLNTHHVTRCQSDRVMSSECAVGCQPTEARASARGEGGPAHKRYSSIVESQSFKRNLGFDPQSTKSRLVMRRDLAVLQLQRSWLPKEETGGSDSKGVVHGQATKGAWWMPRHQKAKKDAVNCEKPRGVVRERRSVGVRMGKPGRRNGLSPCTESIGAGSQPREVKHLSTWRKRNQPRLR